MLLDLDDILGILQCPGSGRKLRRVGDKLIAENDAAVTYDIVDGYPVLIDFDDSVLEKASVKTLASAVARPQRAGLSGIAKRIVSPPKRATVENVRLMRKLLLSHFDHPRVLIIGGGTVGQGMNWFYDDPGVALVSFDIYASRMVQFVADAHHIPLADGSFDGVVIQAVLEHVLEPHMVVGEIFRVLKKDALVYAETPFLQHVHEGPYDFTRFTESGHRYLFKNFELIKSGASAGAGTQLLWSIDNFFRGVFRSKGLGKMTKLCFFWLQYTDRLIPEPYNIDAASGVFFMGRKRPSLIDGKGMVAHYKGAQK
jgi:SAM-dependent methyltransferase